MTDAIRTDASTKPVYGFISAGSGGGQTGATTEDGVVHRHKNLQN